MKLSKLTNDSLITLNSELNNKDSIIKYLVKQLYLEGKIESEEDFYQAVLSREGISETGISNGLAIPHGKCKSVKEACFAVLTTKEVVKDWESVEEGNKVKYVFLLAIPEEDKDGVQMKLLSELMTKMSNQTYISKLVGSKNNKEFINNLDFDVNSNEVQLNDNSPVIVAVTACAAGIAHTYMAAEALVKAGQELGVKVVVEKQGANGIEGKHTQDNLSKAVACILAIDVAIKEQERFAHLPTVKTKVSEPLKNAKGLVEEALNKSKTQTKKEYVVTEEAPDKLSDILKRSVLTGISYMIPLIVAGGMVLAFAVLIAQGFHLTELYAQEGSWLFFFRKLGGGLLGTLMVPVMAAYMAYSIGEKPALAPGFAAGLCANMLNGGFLLGMLGGIIAGFMMKKMKEVIPARGTFAGFISFWVYPVVSVLLIGFIMYFILGTPVAWLNNTLVEFLKQLSGTNAALLGAVLGIMVSFDLGGPVNKAAYAFCVAAMADGVIMPYAAFASVKMVSAFAVTFATVGFKKVFSEEEVEIGKSTWLLGLAGITEGAIPFMMNHPISVIGSLCAGSAVTGAIVAVSNIGLDVPGAGIFSLFVLKQAPLPYAMLVWLGAAILGAIISTALLVFTRSRINKKQGVN